MITSSLRKLLLPLQNREIALWQTNYLRGQFPFLGIKTPVLRKVIEELKTIHPTKDWRNEVQELWKEPEREFHHGAIFWAIAHRKKAEAEDLKLYEKMVLENSWWDTVDTISPHLMGAHFHRFPSLISRTEEWLISDELWLKRAALIYPLYQRRAIDEERLFRYCKALSQERDFFIRKAIGWMLREYSKTNPAQVKKFLETTPLSPLSKREGAKYLNLSN